MNSSVANLQHHYSLLYQNAILHQKMTHSLQNAKMALCNTRLEMV